jgi:hypothetical protein
VVVFNEANYPHLDSLEGCAVALSLGVVAMWRQGW